MRLDQYLQQHFNLESRHQAQRLILEGFVTVNAEVIDKNSYDVSDQDQVEITDRSILKYVSRGGLKLAHALKECALDVNGFVCLDIGQSTGGFTDCLLQEGARKVIGIEVGHGQLHHSLKGHPKIKAHDHTHILKTNVVDILDNEILDLIVVDLSFISLTKVIPKIREYMSAKTRLLALVKPQFEVGATYLSKSGLVKDPKAYALVEEVLNHSLAEQQIQKKMYFESFPRGGDGNQEFFVFASL